MAVVDYSSVDTDAIVAALFTLYELVKDVLHFMRSVRGIRADRYVADLEYRPLSYIVPRDLHVQERDLSQWSISSHLCILSKHSLRHEVSTLPPVFSRHGYDNLTRETLVY